MATIRNPVEWSADQIGAASHQLGSFGHAVHGAAVSEPQVRRISTADLREALRRGYDDFVACRSDVAFIAMVYPLAGVVLAWFFFDYRLIPLIFPTASGFALVGPVAAIGLYEMSRQRERGEHVTWWSAVEVLKAPSFGPILLLGFGLFAVLALWLVTAHGIYSVTMGPEQPQSAGQFASDVFLTGPGWAMIIVGCAVGFLFAVVVLAISVISFPLLLDRDVGLPMAVLTSVRVAAANPRTVLTWGLIVAAGLVLGTIPIFLGMIVVMPVLGHATWHVYRAAVARRGEAYGAAASADASGLKAGIPAG